MRTIQSPTGSGRRERRRLETRARLIDVAQELFETKGYEGTTIAEVCERADVAYGTFFNHFDAKVDLLRSLAGRAVDGVIDDLDQLAKQPGDISDHLILLFAGAAQTFEDLSDAGHELLGRIQALGFLENPDASDRRYRAAFEAYLQRRVDEGFVRSDVPVATLAEVLSSTFTSMSLSWVHASEDSIRARAASVARFLAASMAPARARNGEAD